MILLYAGRRPGTDAFPDANVGRVCERIGEVVETINPSAVVGSAAAGADLLVLKNAVCRSIPAHVLVAGDREAFRAGSVADKGGSWVRCYDALLGHPGVTLQQVPLTATPDESYRAVTNALGAQAERVAAGHGEEIAVLAVSELPAAGTLDHTEELVEAQRRAGRRVLRIDPTQPEGGTRP